MYQCRVRFVFAQNVWDSTHIEPIVGPVRSTFCSEKNKNLFKNLNSLRSQQNSNISGPALHSSFTG